MYENHFSIKLISIEKLYIMTTMSYIQKFKYDGIWYVKECDFDELKSKWKKSYDELHDFADKELNKVRKERDAWKLEYSNQEKWSEHESKKIACWNEMTERYDDKIVKLKSIITDYENKITRYIDKIDEQESNHSHDDIRTCY